MKHIHLLGLKDYPGEDIQTIIFSMFKRELKVRRLKAIIEGKHFKTKENIYTKKI